MDHRYNHLNLSRQKMLFLFLALTILTLIKADTIDEKIQPPEAPPGWRMIDRFYGFRFEIHGTVQGVWFRKSTMEKADEYACFGWVQNTVTNTVVGEARCGKKVGPKFQQWLTHGPSSATVTRAHFKVYEDTKIKLHFSDFAILDDARKTCFRDNDGPHSCSGIEQAAAATGIPQAETFASMEL